MQGLVLQDWRIWLMICEATGVAVWLPYCFTKYKEYKAEMLANL